MTNFEYLSFLPSTYRPHKYVKMSFCLCLYIMSCFNPHSNPWIRFSVFAITSLIVACRPPVPSDEPKDTQGLLYDLQKTTPPSPKDNAKIHIGQDTVILAKAHVITTKPERYQPSFRLEGIIAPKTRHIVHLPTPATLQTLHVHTGQSVKKGDVIATFYQKIPLNPDTELLQDKSPSATLEHTQLPIISTSQTDTTSMSATESSQDTQMINNPVAIITPTFGQVEKIFIENTEKPHAQGTKIVSIIDERQLKFISLLPAQFKQYVQIGDGVNFSTKDGRLFSGQIAKITPDDRLPNVIDIHVNIKADKAKKANLQLGDWVGGYVEYGQIQVGVLVPVFAVFDKHLKPIDANTLNTPPYKPATPIHGFVWVIGQDEKLALAPIEVIEYRPKSEQYLIYGVALDGLIVLADLPRQAKNKWVRLK